MNKVVIECECHTHLLMAEYDPEYKEIYLAMFRYGNQKPSFWRRLKLAFKYLRNGKIYSDQLILNADESKKLASFINDSFKK